MYRHMKSSSKSDTLSFRNFRIMCRTRKRLVNISLLILTHRRISTTINLVMLVQESETWFFLILIWNLIKKHLSLCEKYLCQNLNPARRHRLQVCLIKRYATDLGYDQFYLVGPYVHSRSKCWKVKECNRSMWLTQEAPSPAMQFFPKSIKLLTSAHAHILTI
jgi:hypothetical protein